MDFAQNCGVFGTQPPITSMPVRFVDRVGSLGTTDGSGADAEQNPPVPLIVAFSKRVRRARAVPTPVMIILPALRPDVDGLVQQRRQESCQVTSVAQLAVAAAHE
jgi:hypothetical protein